MNKIIQAGALFGVLAVGIGAFGAHGLAEILEVHGRTDTFETGVKYHFYHAIALVLTGLIGHHPYSKKWLKWSSLGFISGILIFSGSLYTLSLTGVTWLGAITPLGGIAFILGWIFLAIAVSSKK
ncbi:DUF423 domain-containing protein [Anditalea andensis]|uniref:Membrane protein n=1 Tax=Anditalea andensis TaxID=1048983 RepID=A0A074L2N1_9BACT|nr:DUF423 domain-containing protein [Anditalea andensis]KEO74730.1 membrane protein [Anditalea andensis]